MKTDDFKPFATTPIQTRTFAHSVVMNVHTSWPER